MRSDKVYAYIKTPRSLKDKETRNLVIKSSVLTIAMVAMTVYQNTIKSDFAGRFTVFFVLWLIMGAIPCYRMFFCSYACIEDEELICNPLGLYKRRYPRTELDHAGYKNGRITIHAKGKQVIAMPDCEAARELVQQLRLRIEE